MAAMDIDVDSIWRAVGTWGRYQWKQLIWYLLSCSLWVIHLLSFILIGYRPHYQCKPFFNDTVENATLIHPANNGTTIWYKYGKCAISVYSNSSQGLVVTEEACTNGWTYDIPREQSFVTEWSLFCDKEELAELTQVLMTIGMAVGNIVFPSTSDRFGRKPTMVFCQLGLLGVALGTSFCQNYTIFIVLRVLTGFMIQGGLAGTSLALETFPTEGRCYTEPFALLFWTTAICIMSPIAYFLRDYSWRYLQLTYALLSVWAIFQWGALDESLRWLIANGKLEEARQVIRNACKWNKKEYKDVVNAGGILDETVEQEMKQYHEDDESRYGVNVTSVHNEQHMKKTKTERDVHGKEYMDDKAKLKQEEADIQAALLNGDNALKDSVVEAGREPTVEKYTAIDIFRYPKVLRVSLILWFSWLTDSLTYYGLFMISSDLYGDRYINFFLSAACEYPAVAFELYAFTRLGRPFSCMLCHGIAAAGLVLATIFINVAGENTAMMAAATAFTLIGKMGITAAFSTNYLLTPESYPTNLRTIGIGVAAFVGKIGAIIAPFSRNLAERALWAPGAVFAVCCIGVVIGMMYIPETSGVELPQTMDELSAHYTNKHWTIRRNVSDANTQQKREVLVRNNGEEK